MNPKSQIRGNNKQIERNQSKLVQDLTFPPSLYALLSQATNSRPRLPFSFVLHVIRFRGSRRGQSGHLVNGTVPYFGHGEQEAELKLDITRRPEKGCHRRRRRRMGAGKEMGRNGIGTGLAQAPFMQR